MLSCFSHVWLFATLWIAAHQAPLSMEFSRQDSGEGCHFFLHRVFPTQELNPSLLHCRLILYHWAFGETPLWWGWRQKRKVIYSEIFEACSYTHAITSLLKYLHCSRTFPYSQQEMMDEGSEGTLINIQEMDSRRVFYWSSRQWLLS